MILQVLAVYDAKARAFAKPFFVTHVDVGIRAFRDHATTPGNEMFNNQEDFTLFSLGTFNDENAMFVTRQLPEQVAFAANVREVTNVQREVA